jgi:hypothetical protein
MPVAGSTVDAGAVRSTVVGGASELTGIAGSGIVISTEDGGGRTAAEAPDWFGALSNTWLFTRAAAEPATSTPAMEIAAATGVFMIVHSS